MRILIIHQNFPGQFRHVAQAWAARPGWQVVGVGHEGCPGLAGVRCLTYKLHRQSGPQQHHYLQRMEQAVLHGQAVARLLIDLRKQGFVPDVILAHPGWGETLYAKDVFPNARLIHFCEWFYSSQGADVGFDPEFPPTFDDHARIRTWNALHLLNLENCDAAITPTQWQRSRHPAAYQSKIVVAHEGIDTELLRPDPNARIALKSGVTLKAGDPVITYVARNLEPYRGFHVFMRALERIQTQHKTCHTIIVGGDDVSYGRRPVGAKNWREKMLAEVKLDMSRVHFVGKLSYDTYRRVLQVSAAHVYLTYPFVLSWSILEAMASGCLVIGSDTAPVREVITHGESGLLTGIFDRDGLADRVVESVDHRSASDHVRNAARACMLQNYARDEGLQGYERMLQYDGIQADARSVQLFEPPLRGVKLTINT
jgi:glycosyltransferase involved in cell wall biosynthesis